MVGRVEPRDALRVGRLDVQGEAARRVGVDAQVLGLRAVEPADQLIVARFGDRRSVVAQIVADPGEGLAPTSARHRAVDELPVAGPIIVRTDGRPDVDEISRRRKSVADELQVALDKRPQAVGPRAVALDIGAVAEPGQMRLALARESDIRVAETVGVGIEVDVVVVRREQHPVLFADVREVAELLQGPFLQGWVEKCPAAGNRSPSAANCARRPRRRSGHSGTLAPAARAPSP